jgi:hypothetical protein
VRETTHDREYDSRFDAAFQPGFEDALGIDFSEVTRDGLDRGDRSETDAPARVRPLIDRFVIALWIAGVALIVAGVIGVTSAMFGFTSSTTSGPSPDYLMSIVFAQLAPWLFSIGIATLVGTLFLLAVRWERRP